MALRPPKIILILPSCKKTLDSLEKLNYKNFQTIVVDNSSSDAHLLRTHYPDVPILEGNRNTGIEWALRKHAEWILLLNNETVIDPNLLNSFLEVAKEPPYPKILGAKILRAHDPEVVEHLGSFWNAEIADFFCPDAGEKDHPYFNPQAVDSVSSCALFMHRSVPEKIGLLEPKLSLFWEGADFCYRARKAGFEVWTAPEAKVWSKSSPSMPYFWWRSRLLWVERNCSEKEKLYKKVLFPELWKMFLQLFYRNVEREKAKAGCMGAFDFFRKRFHRY